MREQYIDLMEQALSAYSDEHINRYFNDVKTNGLTEHGFPRLTVNIGILLAHGRRRYLIPIFTEMMEFCCKTIPTVKAANDFSVREVICCLWEVEKSGIISKTVTERWRSYLAAIEPTACYTRFAVTPEDTVRNWALFTAVSEFFRQKAGLCDSSDFIDLQLLQQLQWFDENGMYMDNKASDNHQPVMYDFVSRALFSVLMDQGYCGKYFDAIDSSLKKSGLLTLKMQSSNGEMAFGGRSNQFLHNEAWMITVFEYEAKRYAREGNAELAARFKSASAKSLKVISHWLSQTPISHIKNRSPTETNYGCERYAYFDKYMITVASVLYMAYLICDDSIPFMPVSDHEPCVFATSERFHKLFLKSGGYGLEFDLNADTQYDANGLGRIHRYGAPSAICLSVPCPQNPHYKVDIEAPFAFSACSAVLAEDDWIFGADESTKYEILASEIDADSAFASLLCCFANGRRIWERYTVNESGVLITIKGDDEIAFSLPAFCFDGEISPEIIAQEHSLSISYKGWLCQYTTDGSIVDSDRIAANRNGHYRVFIATAQNSINVKIEITKL